jgi:nucleotide-binding universal stress UspA family protein
MPKIDHIMVATDFSHDANRALTMAAEMARALSARLTLFHVVQMPSYKFFGGGVYVPSPELTADIVDDAKRWLAAAKERITGVAVETICLDGDPAALIAAWAAEHKPDLLVLGTHGRRGLRRLILGSVAEHVLREVTCPVLTVRDEEQTAA